MPFFVTDGRVAFGGVSGVPAVVPCFGLVTGSGSRKAMVLISPVCASR
jgi:hypothetical protein